MLTGCPDRDDAPQQAATPFAHEEVTIVVPEGRGFSSTWEILLEEWSAQTGAGHRMIEYDPADTEELQRLAREAGGRLLIFPDSMLGELAADDLLSPIPQEQLDGSGLDWRDIFQGLRERVGSIERSPAVVPIRAPVLVVYYRRDLLEAAGLAPPQTWQDYQALLESLDRWAPGLTAVEPWNAEFRTTMFLSRAAAYAKHPGNYSLYFDIETGEPLIGTPGFVRALEESLAALRRMPPDVRQYGPADCRREFLAGRAALAIAFETGAPESSEAVRAEQVEAGFTRLPGTRSVFNLSSSKWESPRGGMSQVTLTGFEGLLAGVSAGDRTGSGRAAWNLLSTLTVDFLEQAFPGDSRSLTRESQIGAAQAWLGNDLTASEAGRYLEAVARSLRDTNLVAELPVAGRARFQSALNDALTRAIEEDVSPEAVLSQAAEEWREISQDVGEARVLNGYRRVLGLSPLKARD